ncbi:MAG: sulfatase-like hydrolase/transferase [Bacteroidales bacterium]|nr:sulfatase-like hydrolase/transferase [Bacteroidales bacterium]
MQKRLIAFGSYAIFWFLFFVFARIFFLAVQFSSTALETVGGIAGAFVHGAKLDISTIGYYLLIPVLIAIPSLYFNSNWYRVFMRWYTYLLIVFSSSIVVADSNLYSYWGFRMDYTPVLYLKTPGEAMASATTSEIVFSFFAIVVISSVFIFIYKKFFDKLFGGLERMRLWPLGIIGLLLFWGALIIPIRGGFGVAPINAGSVYFSNKMFLNHSAVNAVWNVGTSAFTSKPVKNPYIFGDNAEAAAIVDSLIAVGGDTRKVLNTSRPNIMILALESFSGYVIGPLGGDSLVTPNFNRYVKEGLFFSEFYAAGTRTDKAMPAILDGYPAQPAQSIIKEPKKSQSLPSLVKILIGNGYRSSFWYGGEINFANFNSFVIGSGFQTIVTKDDFDPKDYNSKWGVHDHVLFSALKDSLKSVKEPFLNVVLTLSSHEPFDVPMDPVFAGTDNMTKYKNSVYYADKALGEFLDWAKGTDWWQNTVVILVADHCGRVSEDQPIFTQELFKIPMLWIGGALESKGTIINKTGGQVDIPVTLLNQLGIAGTFPFAKDLLSGKSNAFAFYVYNEGFGFITDTSAYVYDHKLRMHVINEGKNPEYAEKTGKAFLQVLFNDYLKR